MKKIMLCRREGGCCPHVEEDTKKGITYIVDGDQKIALNEEQLQELIKHVCKKQSACKCAVCNP